MAWTRMNSMDEPNKKPDYTGLWTFLIGAVVGFVMNWLLVR